MIDGTSSIDKIVTELSSYSLDRLPQVKKRWIYEINKSSLPFCAKVKVVYFAGTACDLVMQRMIEKAGAAV